MDVHELAEGRITLDEAKVGDWFAPCCLHDLQRFESEHDLADMLAFVEEMGPIRVWRTCRDAVAELIPEEDADSLRAWSRICSAPERRKY